MGLLPRFRSRYAFIRGNFLILVITWILMFSTSPIPGTYASKYFKTILGANDFLLGVITFSGLIAIALVQFPGGYLADKHGRRWLVYTMTFGVAFAYIFFIFAPSWPLIVVGTMIQNFCLLYQPALYAIMLDSVSPENRGAGFSMQAVITNLVGLPAALIAGYLILIFNLNIGMRIAYSIAIIAYFAAAFLRVKLKETLPSLNGDRESRPSILAAFKEYPQAVKESLSVWSKTPRSVYYLFISNAVISSLIVGCNTYFIIYATENLKITNFQWALLMALMSFTVAIPSIIAGLRMDKVGRKNYLIAAYLCYAPAMILFVFGNFLLLFLAFFFFGLGQVLQSSSYQSLLGDLTPRELRGRVVGCSQFFLYLGQAFMQLLIGLLFAYVWRPLPFLMLATSVIPIAILVYYKVFEEDTKQI
jgi:MFS family permease